MHKRTTAILLLLIFNVVAFSTVVAAENALTDLDASSVELEVIIPIPQSIKVDPLKVALGKQLFEDKRLSGNGKMACVDCHLADKGGADGEDLSMAINDKRRSTNTPSIFNLGLMPKLGWVGVGRDLGEVAAAIIKSKQGLATTLDEMVGKLNQMPEYKRAFAAIYADGVQPAHIKEAFAEYMRSLITPDSRFDQYLRGNETALNEGELAGYELFKSYGCSSCHNGVNIGGAMVSPFGIFGDYVEEYGRGIDADLGLYNKTKKESDKYVFRVPSLRNVALTAPYFHDGSGQDLKKSVDIMSRYMLGRKMPPRDIDLIVKFLESLNGKLQGEQL